MEGQHDVAVESDYTFVRRASDVKRLVELGRLVEVKGNADYRLSKVSFPYTRPEVLSFIEHFAREYRKFSGQQLVVTSLTRPTTLQPRNAHELSVHPAGMAVDLRIPADTGARRWLEQGLLALETEGALDVTREKSPPHYHVAVFAGRYLPIAARQDSLRVIEQARADSIAKVEKARADSLADVSLESGSSRAPLFLGALTALLVAVPVARRKLAGQA